MSESIATSIIETLKSFNDFIDLARNLDTPDVEGLSVGRWEDELGRLRMWAANIGAHQIGQSSLDYRLRDASHIRQQVLKLLETIRRRLKDAREVLDEVSECDDDGSSDGEESDQDEPSEIAQMRDSVATMISCLFQMSMLIRNPAKHDVRRESSHSGISAFAPYDINHVREKFPKANEVLVSRLGLAITQRRKYLSYRERHAAKLKQGLSGGASGGDTVTIGGLSNTIATDPHQKNIDFDDHASDSGVSQTSYAPTLKGGGNITIPPAPKASHNGEPFECPFCYHIIALDRGHSWAKHVFQDLQPYVCLEADCMTPQKLYTNRREWIYHMRNVHTKSERQEEPQGETPSRCSLCGIVCVNIGYLNKHVARHMQELALFVLPQDDEDLEDDSNSNEVHIQSADSQASNESLDEDGTHSILDDSSELELAWDRGARVAKPEDMAVSTGGAGGPNPFPLPYQTQSFGTPPATISGSEEEEDMKEEAFGLNERRLGRQKQREVDLVEFLGLNRYRCKCCGKTVKNLSHINKHVERHMSWKCSEPSCERNVHGFLTENERDRHFNESHFSSVYKCRVPSCTYEGKLGSDFIKHLERVHNLTFSALEKQHIGQDSAIVQEMYEEKVLEAMKKQKQRDEEEEKAFNERMRSTLLKAGYTEETIEKTLKGKKLEEQDKSKIIDPTRPTYIKVHRKYLSPDTLDLHNLPWEWDERDSNYMIIKRWIPEHEQDILFEHTRSLREGRQLTKASLEIKKERDNVFLVRKKSPLGNQGPTDYENSVVESRTDKDFDRFEGLRTK